MLSTKVKADIRLKLGRLVVTIGAADRISRDDMQVALCKHQLGDWGDVCEEDWELNNQGAEKGDRILSSYKDRKGTKFWIITEWDRSATTILLPEEY